MSLFERARGPIVLIAAAFALTPTSSASAVEVLKLDLSNAGNEVTGINDNTSFAVASSVLETGKPYVITVSGTGSIWHPAAFSNKGTCGVGEAQPIEPTPGRENSIAGWDAATVFAAPGDGLIAPLGKACSEVGLPISTIPAAPNGAQPFAGFEFALGQLFNRPTPVGGRRDTPRADHTYTYEVVGKGAPARFRFADRPATDNSGILTITIRGADECAAISCAVNAGTTGDQVAPPTTVSAATQSVSTPGERTCTSLPRLKLKVIEPKGVDFVQATFYIDGKKKLTAYRQAKKASKQLVYPRSNKKHGQPRTLTLAVPRKQFKLRIVAITTRKQRITIKRTVPACGVSSKAKSIRVK